MICSVCKKDMHDAMIRHRVCTGCIAGVACSAVNCSECKEDVPESVAKLRGQLAQVTHAKAHSEAELHKELDALRTELAERDAAAVAYVLDRVEQYRDDSGSRCALEVLAHNMGKLVHVTLWKEGGFDDLKRRAPVKRLLRNGRLRVLGTATVPKPSAAHGGMAWWREAVDHAAGSGLPGLCKLAGMIEYAAAELRKAAR